MLIHEHKSLTLHSSKPAPPCQGQESLIVTLRERAALGTAEVVIGIRATTQARLSLLPALIGLSSGVLTSRLSAVNAVGQVGQRGQGDRPRRFQSLGALLLSAM